MIFPISTDLKSVGSMVVYEEGRPKRSDYRKFKIKECIQGPDDYASMHEVLTRRFPAWFRGTEGVRRKRRQELGRFTPFSGYY